MGLIIAGFIYTVRNFAIESSLSQESYDFKHESFSVYFEDCVEYEVLTVFSNLLLQGGYLFEKDNGYYSLSSVPHEGTDEILTYSILGEPSFIYDMSHDFSPPPSYTGLMTVSAAGYPKGIFNKQLNIPYFGQLNLPKLCMRDGPNDPNVSFAKYSCPTELYNIGALDEDTVIQNQLTKVFASKIYSCAESPAISDNFDIEISDFSKMDIVFADEDVLIKSDMVVYYVENGLQKEYAVDFNFPLDFKNFYSFVYDILDKETKRMDFKISEDYSQSAYYKPYYEVKLTTDFSGTSDLLEIKNNKYSGVLNNSVAFRGLIQNRRPYIEYIPDFLVQGESDGLFAMPLADRQEKMILKAYDPDDDEVYALRDLEIASPSPESNEFSTLSGVVIGDKVEYIFTGDCPSQCDSSGGVYFSTIYLMNISVSDGEKSDYQTFEVRVQS